MISQIKSLEKCLLIIIVFCVLFAHFLYFFCSTSLRTVDLRKITIKNKYSLVLSFLKKISNVQNKWKLVQYPNSHGATLDVEKLLDKIFLNFLLACRLQITFKEKKTQPDLRFMKNVKILIFSVSSPRYLQNCHIRPC